MAQTEGLKIVNLTNTNIPMRVDGELKMVLKPLVDYPRGEKSHYEDTFQLFKREQISGHQLTMVERNNLAISMERMKLPEYGENSGFLYIVSFKTFTSNPDRKDLIVVYDLLAAKHPISTFLGN